MNKIFKKQWIYNQDFMHIMSWYTMTMIAGFLFRGALFWNYDPFMELAAWKKIVKIHVN